MKVYVISRIESWEYQTVELACLDEFTAEALKREMERNYKEAHPTELGWSFTVTAVELYEATTNNGGANGKPL